MYVCICNQVTQTQLRKEIKRGAITVRQLRESLGVTNQCGKCASCVKACLKEHSILNTTSGLLIPSACNV